MYDLLPYEFLKFCIFFCDVNVFIVEICISCGNLLSFVFQDEPIFVELLVGVYVVHLCCGCSLMFMAAVQDDIILHGRILTASPVLCDNLHSIDSYSYQN